jgi:hypothetical protein
MLGSAMRCATLLLALLAALVVASTAGAAGLPGALTDGGTVTKGQNVLVRPGQIVYTGDGSGFLAGPGKGGRRPKPTRLKWSSWTAGAAVGSGDNWLNNCEPFCAAGTFSQYATTIKLYRPRTMLGLSVFTRMTLHYTGRPNPFTHKPSQTFKLVSAPPRQLFWNVT